MLQRFTKIEEWTGPDIPEEGILEKGMTKLQPKHKHQFITEFLREQIKDDPHFKNVRFY